MSSTMKDVKSKKKMFSSLYMLFATIYTFYVIKKMIPDLVKVSFVISYHHFKGSIISHHLNHNCSSEAREY